MSAPVFATVAQQVLEYLGVPHDQPLKSKKEMVAQRETADDAPSENTADLNAMFDDVNSLPADDPLRSTPKATSAGDENEKSAVVASRANDKPPGLLDKLSAKVAAGARAPNESKAGEADGADGGATASLPKAAPVGDIRDKRAVVVNAGLRVPVPSFDGAALRTVVEGADAVGLRVQAVGSGLAREQAPAAGTMVPAGTEIVVRFSR